MKEYNNTDRRVNGFPPPPPAQDPHPSGSIPANPPIHQSITPPLRQSTIPPPAAPAPSLPQPVFPRSPGETPRACGAFLTFFQLGPARSLQAVADHLGEPLGTVKNWSSRFRWNDRILHFHSGLLQQQAEAQVAAQVRHAADWAARLERFREQEWDAAQKLLAAAQCFLESFGEEDLRRMTLAQVSRALKASSAIGRLALAGAELPQSCDPPLSPIQHQLLNAVRRVYGHAPQSSSSSSPSSNTPSQPSTLNSQPSTVL